MKQVILFLTVLLLPVSLFAQKRVVHGKLTAFNTYPVQNVEVTAKKAKTSILSDSLGQFSIVCLENDVIKIKPKAFQQVMKRIGPDTDSLTFNLVFIDNKANRKLAVGYGYVNEQDLTYAITHLEQENSEFCHYTNIFEVIKGRFAGVEVSNGEVYIRGTNSFHGKTSALYIVNDMPVNSIEWIEPCQLKSINILKDASSSIYGTRGSNGVVMIETR